jgi:hypothetical protein
LFSWRNTFKINYIANIAYPCGYGKRKPCEAEKWEGELSRNWSEELILKVKTPENRWRFDMKNRVWIEWLKNSVLLRDCLNLIF